MEIHCFLTVLNLNPINIFYENIHRIFDIHYNNIISTTMFQYFYFILFLFIYGQ